MSFELFLAWKFLFGRRFGIFRLITTLIAVGGTALGVGALLVTLAVMDGFRTDIQEKILGTQPHLQVVNPLGASIELNPALVEAVRQVDHVAGVAPYANGQALLQTSTRATGILVRGIDPWQEKAVVRLEHLLTQGRWEDLTQKKIILGRELALSLGARLEDEVTLLAPEPDAPAGHPPILRKYTVVGIFQSGMYEIDANMAYLSLKDAQDLLSLRGRVSGLGVKVDDLDRTSEVVKQLQLQLGSPFWTRSWAELNRPLFSAMQLERTVMFIILTLIILVSSFTIISNLLLLTLEKARDIGILQALGASPAQIGKVFWLNGLFLGGGGVALGLTLGIGISLLLGHYPIIRLPPEVYYIDRLPIRLSAGMIESVGLCAMVLVLASVLYPARKARQMDPLQAIRHG